MFSLSSCKWPHGTTGLDQIDFHLVREGSAVLLSRPSRPKLQLLITCVCALPRKMVLADIGEFRSRLPLPGDWTLGSAPLRDGLEPS